MFPHHSDQMSQRSQVSRIALCMAKVKVTQLVSEWVTDWVTRSPIELFWTAKKREFFSFVWSISCHMCRLDFLKLQRETFGWKLFFSQLWALPLCELASSACWDVVEPLFKQIWSFNIFLFTTSLQRLYIRLDNHRTFADDHATSLQKEAGGVFIF